MPFDAPVTIATLPSSLLIFCPLGAEDDRASSLVLNYGTIELRQGVVRLICMKPLVHPALEDITVEGILHALSDPTRVEIFKTIADASDSTTCSAFLTVGDKV